MKSLENFEKLVSDKESNFLSKFKNYKNNQMQNTETKKQFDWQKAILYIVIFAFIFAYGKSCNSENTAIAKSESATKKADSLSNIAGAEILKNEKLQSELADQKSQYKTIEKLVYKVSADLVKLRQNTAQKVKEVKTYTNNEKQAYFDSIYGKSEVMAVKLDSIASEVVIIDLEVGKGAIKENVKLNEKVGLLYKFNDNLLSQNSNLEAQNNNSLSAYLKEKEASELHKKNALDNLAQLKKEKRKKTLWKLATIPAFVLGVVIAK
jgi:hypothetical protein